MNHLIQHESVEIIHLRALVVTLQHELNKCRSDRSAGKKVEESFRLFSEGVPDYAFITFGPDSRIVSWSVGAERILGYSEVDVIGQSANIIFTPEDRAAGVDQDEMDTALNHGRAEDERWHIRKDGTKFWASGVLTAHRNPDASLQGYSKVLRDLTASKLANDHLHAAEEQFRLFVENVRDYALVPVDVRGIVSGWNTGGEHTFGYSREEIIGQSAAKFFIPEDAENGESERDLRRALEHGRSEDERWMVRKDGSRFWARWVTNAMYDSNGKLRGFTKVMRDESDKKRGENRLKEALKEKELLLRETHHRVKNNLNVINSLLSLQAGQVTDRAVQQMFDELKDRVRTIAAIHETLYTSPNFSNILIGPYIEHVLRDLVAFHQIGSKHITLAVDSDDMVLSIEQVLPLGLIANELTSNALKHGFPQLLEGKIVVSLRYVPECPEGEHTVDSAWCELTVQDNGIGVMDRDTWEHSTSMGLRIVRLLTKQLNGTLTLEEDPGTRICVRFPLTIERDGISNSN